MFRRNHVLPLAAAILAVIGAVSLIVIPASAQRSASDGAADPEIIAIKFHADWCGYCKQMGPVFKELQAKYDQEPALYVVFDHTRDFNRLQSEYLASAMGLDKVWAEHGGKTGFVLLIDAETRTVVERLSHQQNLKEMGAALQRAVQRAD